VSRVNGLDARAEKVAKQFDDFLEGVIEEHQNCQGRGGNGNGSLENEHQKDFVDVLLQIEKENVIGFPIERLSIKALILVSKLTLSLSLFIFFFFFKYVKIIKL
jgi:hypothetical protein